MSKFLGAIGRGKTGGILLAAAGAALIFLLGWSAGQAAAQRQLYAALRESAAALPDPEHCALCGEITRHHALYLMDLATGRMDRLTVYETDPDRPWEVLPMDSQSTGTLQFQPCAGLTGVRDAAHTYTVDLPEDRALMDPAHFCRDCRTLLAGAVLERYVILDRYDPGCVRAYPVRRGSRVIRDYRVSVETRQGGRTLRVTGLLE